MSYCQIMVAIPARNEARTIAACIESIDTASQRVDVAVLVVVAADSCTDSTASTARSVPVIGCDVEVIEGRWGRAGAARADAVGHGLAMLPADRPSWIANTDADCVVPATWLETQIVLAAHVEAIGGIVQLDPESTGVALPLRSRARINFTAIIIPTSTERTSDCQPMRIDLSGDGAGAPKSARIMSCGPRWWPIGTVPAAPRTTHSCGRAPSGRRIVVERRSHHASTGA